MPQCWSIFHSSNVTMELMLAPIMEMIVVQEARHPCQQYLLEALEDLWISLWLTWMMIEFMVRGNLNHKMLEKHVDQSTYTLGGFFYANFIPFNMTTSPSYFNMIRLIGAYDQGLKPLSMYDLRTWILMEELSSTKKDIQGIRRTWSQRGVTITSDLKKTILMNILVNNSYVTIFLKFIEASHLVKDAGLIFILLGR